MGDVLIIPGNGHLMRGLEETPNVGEITGKGQGPSFTNRVPVLK